MKGLAGARVADTGAWESPGERSAAHALARSTGTSVGQASEALTTAKRLEKLPAVAAAARAGQLSPSQAAAGGRCGCPGAENRLLEKARRSSLAELREECAPFLAAVVTKGEQVVGVAHLGRTPTATQQTALEWLYPTCVAEGCAAGTWLGNHHRVDWATSHLTVLDLLDRLCSHHHDLKSLDGWGLVDGRGKSPFVPPDDPRHPRHANAPPVAAA